jgi:putative Mg2+ transporter-C (MgtC) family protein
MLPIIFLEAAPQIAPVWWEQVLRLFGAVVVGAVLGYERELKNKPAGFLTFILVSVGAALIALLQLNLVQLSINFAHANPQYADPIIGDPGRVIAQVVSGIGFLGAGTIIHNKGAIKGITTAALLWVSAALGLVIGIGGTVNYILAAATALVFIPISFLSRNYSMKFAEAKRTYRIRIVFEENHEKEVYDAFANQGILIKKTFFHNKYQKDGIHIKEVFMYFNLNKKRPFNIVIEEISALDCVYEIEEA